MAFSYPAGIDWHIGLTVGAILWIAGIVLTFLLAVLEIVGVLALLVALAPVSGTILGWFAAHTWYLGQLGNFGGGMIVSTVVAVVLLVGGGYYAARNGGSGVPGWKQGTSIVAGYLLLAVISALLVVVLGGGVDVVGVVISLVVAGIVFPAVFGAIGGSLADR